MRKRVMVLTLCVCVLVCVCEESTALEHRFYNKVSIAADCLLRFQDFQLTELSDVVSFMSYRSFCSSLTVAAIFLNHILIRATTWSHCTASQAHMQGRFNMECTICHMVFLEFALLVRGSLLCSVQFHYLAEREVVSF